MSKDVIQVLSIEDNPADAALIREKLAEAQGVGWDLPRFEVKHVTRMKEALAHLSNEAVDVVLSDLDLPDSRAGDTVATLREHIPLSAPRRGWSFHPTLEIDPGAWAPAEFT
jgi:CheY-like chemotaxis protein